MFGALNRFIGRLDAEPAQQPRNGPSDNAFGFQVLRNKDAELPLEPWFDFVIGINGHLIVGTVQTDTRASTKTTRTGRPRPQSIRDRNPQLRWRKCLARYLERKGSQSIADYCTTCAD